jgi:signal transduction histidine kinase
MGGLRSLVVDIYPPTLRSAGLPAALRDLTATLTSRSTNARIEVDEDAVAALTLEQQQAVFRVAQECLRNTVNHAAASEAVIRVEAADEGVLLEVSDNGRGFDPAVRPDEHLGVSLISDVATSIGARLELRTAPGQGTSWRMLVPTR